MARPKQLDDRCSMSSHAALEVRVKELERALVEITNIKTRDAPYLTDNRYEDRVMWALVECRRKARAAIREGGEHG